MSSFRPKEVSLTPFSLRIAACERIDSGELDDAYNRADARYGARQGISSRSNCPVFLAEKTIAHALKTAIEESSGTPEDAHDDGIDLWNIFCTVYEHSMYRRETWDQPSGHGDYPTPFGFLLAEILSDYRSIYHHAWATSTYGRTPPPTILGPVIRMWTACVIRFTSDDGYVSDTLRRREVVYLLEKALDLKHADVHAIDNRESQAAWTELFIDKLDGAVTASCSSEQRDYLGEVIDGMDLAKNHISENRDWLRQKLGLDGTGGTAPQR